MKRIYTLAAALLLAALIVPSVSEAGLFRNLLGKGKAVGKAVLRKASHPFGACRSGRCG